jgi:hypothetical protein
VTDIVIATPCGSSFVHASFAASVAMMTAKLTSDGFRVRVLST